METAASECGTMLLVDVSHKHLGTLASRTSSRVLSSRHFTLGLPFIHVGLHVLQVNKFLE